MKRLLFTVFAFAVLAGCKSAHDPAKWYLTGYENGKLLIRHDHKLYTARCFQSFSAGQKNPDSTPQCSDMLEIPGIGHEIPEKSGKDTTWLSMANYAYFTPTGDGGPQYQLIFDSIKENGR
jgi:hypothetical protein